ncbi:MAG TPA: guanylate kinase, partial [Nitrospira sp.]|nr:guanylate kinase [Nitrospira sp.]
ELQSIFRAERLKSKRMDLQWLERNFTGECNAAPAG